MAISAFFHPFVREPKKAYVGEQEAHEWLTAGGRTCFIVPLSMLGGRLFQVRCDIEGKDSRFLVAYWQNALWALQGITNPEVADKIAGDLGLEIVTEGPYAHEDEELLPFPLRGESYRVVRRTVEADFDASDEMQQIEQLEFIHDYHHDEPHDEAPQ